MFKRWFELQGKMPLRVDRTCGHIDRFVEIMFPPHDRRSRHRSDHRQRRRVRKALPGHLAHRAARLLGKSTILLRHPLVTGDKVADARSSRSSRRTSRAIGRPMTAGIKANGKRDPKWWEHAIDSFIHSGAAVPQAAGLFLTSLRSAPHRMGGRSGAGGESARRSPQQQVRTKCRGREPQSVF